MAVKQECKSEMDAKESKLRSTIEAEVKARATSKPDHLVHDYQPAPDLRNNGLVYDNRLIYSTLEVGHTRNLSSDYQVQPSKLVKNNASMLGRPYNKRYPLYPAGVRQSTSREEAKSTLQTLPSNPESHNTSQMQQSPYMTTEYGRKAQKKKAQSIDFGGVIANYQQVILKPARRKVQRNSHVS